MAQNMVEASSLGAGGGGAIQGGGEWYPAHLPATFVVPLCTLLKTSFAWFLEQPRLFSLTFNLFLHYLSWPLFFPSAATGGGGSEKAALSVLLALVSDPGLTKALSSGMGTAFITGLVQALSGEKDPRYPPIFCMFICLFICFTIFAVKKEDERNLKKVLEQNKTADVQ